MRKTSIHDNSSENTDNASENEVKVKVSTEIEVKIDKKQDEVKEEVKNESKKPEKPTPKPVKTHKSIKNTESRTIISEFTPKSTTDKNDELGLKDDLLSSLYSEEPLFTKEPSILQTVFKVYKRKSIALFAKFTVLSKKALGFILEKQKVIIAPLLLILLLPALIIFGSNLLRNRQAEFTEQTLSATFVEQAKSDIYYPTSLPEGYRIDELNNITNEELSAYTITNDQIKITVSHQTDVPEPAFMDLFNNSEPIKTAVGTGYIAIIDENLTSRGGLRINNISVLLNASEPIPIDDMQQIISSMKKY